MTKANQVSMDQTTGAMIGAWPADCRQRAFVEGAAWWQFTANGFTMFASERDQAEKEAVKRFGMPSIEYAGHDQ